MTILFVMAFEFGPGPILWIYNAEILNDKAQSVATMLSWTFTLLVGLVEPVLIEKIHGYTFIMFGCLSGVGTLFMYLYMKETLGISERDVKLLYSDNYRKE